MAAYNANVKVIINDLSVKADDESGSLANDIKTFVNSLDDTTNAIISTEAVKLDATRVAYIILYN